MIESGEQKIPNSSCANAFKPYRISESSCINGFYEIERNKQSQSNICILVQHCYFNVKVCIEVKHCLIRNFKKLNDIHLGILNSLI